MSKLSRQDKKLHKRLRKALLDDKWYPSVKDAMKAAKKRKVAAEGSEK